MIVLCFFVVSMVRYLGFLFSRVSWGLLWSLVFLEFFKMDRKQKLIKEKNKANHPKKVKCLVPAVDFSLLARPSLQQLELFKISEETGSSSSAASSVWGARRGSLNGWRVGQKPIYLVFLSVFDSFC